MKKTTVERIANAVPESLKNIVGYIKDNFDEKGQEALSNTSGTLGVIVKIFAQEKIDSYFDELSKSKLSNFGSNVYLKSSLSQAAKSLDFVADEMDLENDVKSILSLLEDTLFVDENLFKTDEILTIFTPIFHPIVLFVKNRFEKILLELGANEDVLAKFLKDYNDHIALTIEENFGTKDYEKHIKEVESFLVGEKESKLLFDMYGLRRIGFKDNESLEYAETYACWKPVSSFMEKEDDGINDKKHKEIEKSLMPAEKLINNYFDKYDTTLENILFLVADFGKGKSVFLKQYASTLAREYINTGDGPLPVYFNLRDFGTYSSQAALGVIADFLLTKYQIKIDDCSRRSTWTPAPVYMWTAG